jgi:hypothetical protein
MKFVLDDGGRAQAGFKGSAGDCAVRSIAIATGRPYAEVYAAINEVAKSERTGKRKRGVSNARTGVYRQTMRRYMDAIGWKWTPTMHIGSGCTVHLHDGELPSGRIIVSLSKHYSAVLDGVIHDTFDPQREEVWHHSDGRVTISRRCVYGYWRQA